MNNLMQMMNNQGLLQRVASLRQQMGCDPNQHIQNLLNSGKVTQDQYNAAVKQAEQLRSLLKI